MKRYCGPALFAATILSLLGCTMMRPVQVSSPEPPLQISAIDKEVLDSSRAFVSQMVKNMPAWLDDDLARFEQSELHTVLVDIQACYAATDNDDFMIDVQQLRIDAHALQTLDDTLKKEWLI